jgi:DNA-binding NarL/FixJ family response regulator
MRLGCEPDMEVVGEVCSGADAVTAAERLQPDVIIMDIEMPQMDGITATRLLTSAGSPARIITLSLHDDLVTRERAAAAGSAAFVAKHQPDAALLAAIRTS